MTTEELQQQLKQLLQEGKTITVSWDCGGDEAFAYIQINGQQLEFGNPLAEAMDMFLINRLDLPSAGEFTLQGGGTITLKEGEIWLNYASESQVYWEEEEYEELVEYSKKHQPEEELPSFEASKEMQPDPTFSGKVALFAE